MRKTFINVYYIYVYIYEGGAETLKPQIEMLIERAEDVGVVVE